MANTLPIVPLVFAKTLSGNTPQTQWFPIVSGQTYGNGAVLVFGTSTHLGQVLIATNPTSNASAIVGIGTFPAANAGAYAGTFDGTALNSDTFQNTGQCVWIANTDTVFMGCLDTALIISGSNSQIGLKCNLDLDGTTGNWFLDFDDTTNPTVTIIGAVDPTPLGYWGGVGDTYARVYFQFIPAATAGL